jgi:7-carboxy-7-deazaguanine synthase
VTSLHLADLTLPVSELFGPTLQGEGPAAGRCAHFLRLMGCNLSCSWCDTPYTWDGSRHDLRAETTHLEAQAIAEELHGRPGILVITGGEPLLHQHRMGFQAVLQLMAAQRRPVHVETNGTVAPSENTVQRVAMFAVSPKLDHAGGHRGRQDPTLHTAWAEVPNAHLKVVCRDPDDVGAAVDLAERVDIPAERVWVMPEGTTTDQLNARWPAIADAAAQLGINATHRLHVLAWGDTKGH